MKYSRLLLALVMVTVVACSAVQFGIEQTPSATPGIVSLTPTSTQGAPATSTPGVATATAMAPTAVQPSDTPLPAATAIAPTPTLQPTQPPALPTLTPVNAATFPYLDDSSTATGLIASLFNALNRREYVRAYSYWDPLNGNVPYDQYVQGYADTQTIQVKIGPVFHDEGAGQIYYSIGVLLKATKTDSAAQTYTACYNMHLGNPGMQGTPPFRPLFIEDGKATLVASGTGDATALAHSCDGYAKTSQPFATPPVTNTQDITQANYLDDRSGPIEVLNSLYNAINRHEYLRAYSYWENAGTSSAVPPFTTFQNGYANTASVTLTTGAPVPGNAAGQIYYTVPAVIVAKTNTGAIQTFSGCYTLHLARPEIQGVPPFQPLAIQSATVNSAANSADHAALLKAACPAQ